MRPSTDFCDRLSELHGKGEAKPPRKSRKTGAHAGGATAAPIKAPARYPSTGSRASSRAGSSAGTAVRCGAARTPSADRAAARPHAGVMGQVPALAQVARRACRDDVVPAGLAAPRARDQVVEGQVVLAAAVLAEEAVTQEHVEPRESGIERRLDVGLERHTEGSRISKEGLRTKGRIRRRCSPGPGNRLDGLLPAPQRERVVAQRPKIGIQHKRRKGSGVAA